MTAMSDATERHTFHRFDEELQALHLKVGEMGELVLSQLRQALEALRNRDLPLAREIIDRERRVNEREVGANVEICTILARRCPVAADLRRVMAASRIVDNLERIGDEAVKLANFVDYLHTEGENIGGNFSLEEIYRLGGLAIESVQAVLEVFERLDGEKAKNIGEFHRGLSQEFQAGLHRVMASLREEKQQVGIAVSQVLMMKALEQVGDHAQNIAEYVLFQLEGEEPRHKPPEFAEDFPLPK